MNFRGNTYSLSRGSMVSASEFGGVYHIFLRRNAPICYMRLDLANRSIEVIDGIVSNGEGCWLIDGNLIEYNSGEVKYLQQ